MNESTHYLLIGGFAAGQAAQAIRKIDAERRIIIVGLEHHPPYDRPPLSKQSLVDDNFKPDDCYSKPDEYYPDHKIEMQMGRKAVAIDRAGRSVMFDNGDTISYEKLLIATGSEPRSLDAPGADLDGVFYLRTIEESIAIRNVLKSAQRVVVIGTGFMGMEVISGANQRGLEVTAVTPESQPWGKFASPTLGQFMADYYAARGVRFVFGDAVAEITGNGKVSGVRTKSGQEIPADAVFACIGVNLNVQLAKDAGLEVDPKDGIIVDQYLQTSDPHIWAAGDVACFEDKVLGKRWHAEHYMNGMWQGEAVGAIMAGEHKPFEQVAYFFSDFLDLHMALRGDPQANKNTTVLGDLAAAEFVELYPDDNGQLAMGLVITHDEAKQEPITEKLETLVRAKAKIADLTATDVGL